MAFSGNYSKPLIRDRLAWAMARRPFSVGIVQVFLVIFAFLGRNALVNSFTMAVLAVTQYREPLWYAVWRLIRVDAVTGAFTAACVLCFIGLQMRRAYGRWMAVSLIVVGYLKIKPAESPGAILGK